MENNIHFHKHQATGWDHFRAKNSANNKIKENENKNKEKSTVFSWLMETLNPFNHIPIVSTIKKAITKANSSIDIVQSALGGMLYGGPLGILKGVGSWALNKFIVDRKEAKVEDEPNNKITINDEKANNEKTLKPELISLKIEKINDPVKIDFFVKYNTKAPAMISEENRNNYSKEKIRNLYAAKKNVTIKVDTTA